MNVNDDNEEKCCGVSTDFIIKLTDFFFITFGDKASTYIPLIKNNPLRNSEALARLYGPMYLEFDDYPPYFDKKLSYLRHTWTENIDIFMDIPIALHIMIWLLGYLKNHGKWYFLNFSTGWKIIAYPRTIVCNNFEQSNLLGNILNSSDNVYGQEDYGFGGSYFRIAPTVIDDYTKNKCLNMQLKNLIPS